MPKVKSRCTFRKADVRRAVAAATLAGLSVARIEYRPNGLIMLHTSARDPVAPTRARRVRYRSANEPAAVTPQTP
jgi:hypothetical protein